MSSFLAVTQPFLSTPRISRGVSSKEAFLETCVFFSFSSDDKMPLFFVIFKLFGPVENFIFVSFYLEWLY